MNRRNHRTFLNVEVLEHRDAPSSVLLGMPAAPASGHEAGPAPLVRLRRVVGDAVQGGGPIASGQAREIELSSFQWGIGRGITSPSAATAGAVADAHWIELGSFSWGAHLSAMPVESISLNFTTINR